VRRSEGGAPGAAWRALPPPFGACAVGCAPALAGAAGWGSVGTSLAVDRLDALVHATPLRMKRCPECPGGPWPPLRAGRRGALVAARTALRVARTALRVARTALRVARAALGVGRAALRVGRAALGVGRAAFSVAGTALGVGRIIGMPAPAIHARAPTVGLTLWMSGGPRPGRALVWSDLPVERYAEQRLHCCYAAMARPVSTVDMIFVVPAIYVAVRTWAGVVCAWGACPGLRSMAVREPA
jgi:hypothetical protein